jgi:hypothetical protein
MHATTPTDGIPMRTRALALALFTLVTAGGPAARAQTAATIDLTFHIGCFGCGHDFATVDGFCYGQCPIAGQLCLGCPWTGRAEVNAGPATCPLLLDAVGSLNTGAGTTSFTMTMVGAMAAIEIWTPTGTASGLVAAAITSPVGNPCMTAVDVRVTGAIAGP